MVVIIDDVGYEEESLLTMQTIFFIVGSCLNIGAVSVQIFYIQDPDNKKGSLSGSWLLLVTCSLTALLMFVDVCWTLKLISSNKKKQKEASEQSVSSLK